MFKFPEVLGEENFEMVMCSDGSRIYMKEVASGKVTEIVQDIRDFLSDLPSHYRIGILMPDGSVGKITPQRN